MSSRRADVPHLWAGVGPSRALGFLVTRALMHRLVAPAAKMFAPPTWLPPGRVFVGGSAADYE